MAAWRSFLLAATSAVFDGRGQMLTRPVSPSHQETHVGYGTRALTEHLVAVEKRPTPQCRSLTAMTRSRRACQAGPARRAGGAAERRMSERRRLFRLDGSGGGGGRGCGVLPAAAFRRLSGWRAAGSGTATRLAATAAHLMVQVCTTYSWLFVTRARACRPSLRRSSDFRWFRSI